MAKSVLFIVLAVLFYHAKAQQSYKAAVVEFSPVNRSTPLETMLKNLDLYRSEVVNARDNGVDIIVFPEYGLTTIVRYPEAYAIDLSVNDSNHKVIEELEALAKENHMYVVVNVLEKATEESSVIKYYNTDLVFDRNGQIIAKYRKINLYDEPYLTPGNDSVTFTTDFGVNFGLMTCFDIMFYKPSRTILSDPRITDVIIPMAWISTMPFYHSLTVQHGYATANGVNLLAANYGKPSESKGGSGIFRSDGTILEVYLDTSPSTKRVVQSVSTSYTRPDVNNCVTVSAHALPGVDSTPNISAYVTAKDFQASQYKFQNVDLTQQTTNTRVCHNSFCCNFDIVVGQANTSDVFKLAAFDGYVTADGRRVHSQICSLLACDNDNTDSCGERANTTTTFTKITVNGNYTTRNGTFVTPVSLKYNLKTVTESNYCARLEKNNNTYVEYQTTAPQKQVLVFGLYGTVSDDGASLQHFGIFVILVISAIKTFIF